MAVYQTQISSEAQFEINEAVEYFNSLALDLGFDFAYEVSEMVLKMEDNPFLFQKIYLDYRRAVIRRFQYNIIYYINRQTINIVAVIHGSRDTSRWKERR
ncbi:MAG: hypothetical protein AB8G22_18505 [Saprospiraceae bacterium]